MYLSVRGSGFDLFLTLPLYTHFIEEPVQSQESEISSIVCVRGARLLLSTIFLLAFELFRERGILFPVYYRYTKKKYKIIDVVGLCRTTPTIECLAPTIFTMRKPPPPPHVINQSARYKLKLLRHLNQMGYQYFPLIYYNSSCRT